MFQTGRSIFRENALKHYMHNGEKTVLPRFISPPIIILLWCLLGLIVFSAGLAWFWRVPVYLNEIGEIGARTGGTSQAPVVVVLLAQSQVSLLHSGMSAQLSVGAKGPQWQQSITTINPTLMSPSQLRQRYSLDASVDLLVTQPSAVALIPVQVALPLHSYLGSIVQIKIQIKTQRLISLLPFLGGLGGA
jgi:hypothetical protein